VKCAALFMLLALAVSPACTRTKGPAQQEPQDQKTTERLTSAELGRIITVEGVAENRKDGAVLRGGNFELWIPQLTGWPDPGTGRVRATGRLSEDHGRPVFVRRPGEPIVQGVEVPEGTDLREASRRWVLLDATWKWLP
jgi:hypothetical protein